MKVENSVIIITGSGKGIGKDIAIELAKLRAICIICSRSESDVENTVQYIRSIGGNARGYSVDLTIEDDVRDFSDWIQAEFGRLDVLINNAGGYPKNFYNHEKQPVNVWDWSYDLWNSSIQINLNTAFLCTKYFFPVMRSNHSGKIINISSRMGRIASQMAGYAAAKSALIALTKTTAIQAVKYGIEVNAISPTVIDTESQRIYNSSVGNDDLVMENTSGIIKTIKYLIEDAPKSMVGQSIDLFKTV